MAIRKFYGTGIAKGFNKKAFFEAVLQHMNGEVIEDDLIDLITSACEYELEGISMAKEKVGSKEKTSTLEKQISKDIISALVPLLTDEPQTTDELIAIATAKGLMTSKGTNFSNPWVNNVFKALLKDDRVTMVYKIVTSVKEKDGMKLTSQAPKIAYVR